MSTLGKKEQVSVQSNQLCTSALNAMVWELNEAGVQFMGKDAKQQAVVNSLLLWASGLTPDERRRFFQDAFQRLEDRTLNRDATPETLPQERETIGLIVRFADSMMPLAPSSQSKKTVESAVAFIKSGLAQVDRFMAEEDAKKSASTPPAKPKRK